MQLQREDGREPLAHILALQVLLLLLEQVHLAGDLVQGRRQRRAQAGEVRAPFVRVDVVGEREDGLLVGTVPLHCQLGRAALDLALEVDDVLVDRLLRLVHVRDEVPDPAGVAELLALLALALVDEGDPQPLGQEGGLA